MSESDDDDSDAVRSVRAFSCANGTIRVEPRWEAVPVEPGCTPVGVFTRLAFASWCERILNEALAHGRWLEECRRADAASDFDPPALFEDPTP